MNSSSSITIPLRKENIHYSTDHVNASHSPLNNNSNNSNNNNNDIDNNNEKKRMEGEQHDVGVKRSFESQRKFSRELREEGFVVEDEHILVGINKI
jgi:hypothetical protein